VLAALEEARSAGTSIFFWALVATALLAYLSSASWGLGLPVVGELTASLAVLILAGCLTGASSMAVPGLWVLNAASRGASGFVMGATLSAMLLGHYYLTAPAMSIEPLQKLLVAVAFGLAGRCLLAALGVWVLEVHGSWAGASSPGGTAGLLLAARWGMGFVGAAVATYLAWKTSRIRSTQSATGILYIAIIFVLFGELTSLVMATRNGVIS
jgi:hypothetical protein